MAVFSETTEHLASRLWHSALDAVRKPEAKSPQQASELLGMLQVHPIFCDLESSLLLRMVSALRSELVAGGDVVIRQGDLGDAFYLVASGELAAFKDGDAAPVETYRAGRTFGELALMYDSPRQATIKCTSADARLYRLGRVPFRTLIMDAMVS